jgi:Ca-activated chloride channel family protein
MVQLLYIINCQLSIVNWKFATPWLLWLLVLLVPVAALYIYRLFKGGAAITVSSTRALESAPKGARYYLRHLPFVLMCCAMALLIVALARPQSSEKDSSSKTEGIDIVLGIDISTSMLARDFEPNRMVAAKDVAAKFVADRVNDRIGLVVFAGESFTQSPLTTDKRTLQTLLGQIEIGMVEDGTAIGNGLATAVNRLTESEAKSKVIILLTDGVNNAGQIAPLTAADIAQTYGIKVYTIGVGTQGMAPYPAQDVWGNIHYVQAKVEIDEEMLREIASKTGGEYFRATDEKTLAAVYDQINEMETTTIDTDEFTLYTELCGTYMAWGLGLLIVAFLLRSLWLKRIP